MLDQPSFENSEYDNFSNKEFYKKYENFEEYDGINLFEKQMFLNDKSLFFQVFIWILMINFLGILFIPFFYKFS